MAAEVMTRAPLRGESFTLLAEEERLRAHLATRGVRTRMARLSDVRALLVPSPHAGGPKGLIVDCGTSAAERIYLYVHLAAHLELGHHAPLSTIVEPVRPAADARHEEAEALARRMWLSQEPALLRGLLGIGPARSALRAALLFMRATYYRLHLGRALAGSSMTAWLRRAFWVTAVACAAPQLTRSGSR